jgi:hypothetical protein
MNRLVLLSFVFLFSVLLGCEDPYGLRAGPYPEGPSPDIFGAGASISLEKSTNGLDADEPPGPSITPGDPVVWEYRVTNTGAVELTEVYVEDDVEGVICTIGTLGVGQEWVCSMEKTAGSGSYTNLGTVSGWYYGAFGVPSKVEASDRSHYEGGVPGGRVPEMLMVAIQIKPGDEFPCINGSSKGRTPVAILASEGFDPLDVDPETILAGGTVPPVRWGRGEDVNGDGFLDLVMHFQTQALANEGLLQDGEHLVITGETFDGASFSGSDLIRLSKGASCR